MKKRRFHCLAAFGAILFTIFVIYFIPMVIIAVYYKEYVLEWLGKLLGLALVLFITAGMLTGGGHAVYNYIAAFKKNVKPGRF